MKNIQNKISKMDRFNVSAMKKDSQKGAGAVEYALILGVITLLVVGTAGVMEGGLNTFFTEITDLLSSFIG